MKLLFLIFVFIPLSLQAMEQNQSTDRNSENSSIITKLQPCLNAASVNLTLSKKSIAVPMVIGFLLILWGAIDGSLKITPFSSTALNTGVGLWLGSAMSIPAMIEFNMIINHAKKLIADNENKQDIRLVVNDR